MACIDWVGVSGADLWDEKVWGRPIPMGVRKGIVKGMCFPRAVRSGAHLLKPGVPDPVSRGWGVFLCRRVQDQSGCAASQVRQLMGILCLSLGTFTQQAARHPEREGPAPPLTELGGDSSCVFHCEAFLRDQW